MKVIENEPINGELIIESNHQEFTLIIQGDELVCIKKGQPLQELIDYLTEVNKDHLTPKNTA